MPHVVPSHTARDEDEEQRALAACTDLEVLPVEAKPRAAPQRASRELRDLLPDVWCVPCVGGADWLFGLRGVRLRASG
jgi:hypothetical protein